MRRLAVACAGTLLLLAGCTAGGERDGSPVADVSTGSPDAAPTTPGGPLTADTGLLPCPDVSGGPAQGPDTLSLFMRYLNHVKVVFQPGAPLEAKAYPGLKHLWGRASARAA